MQKGMIFMTLIDADELRRRLKDSEPSPYDAKFCAMINELAFETDVDAEYYQNSFDKHCIINRVDSIEKINKAINWLMNNVRKAEDLSELCELIELRRKIVRGID
jgi:hypothetical protein